MSYIRALLATLVVLCVPGLFVALLARWRLSSIKTWAAVPVLSLGVTFLLAEITSPFSWFGVPAFLALVLVLGVTVLARVRRDRAREDVAPTEQAVPKQRAAFTREQRLSFACLAAGIVFGLVIWLHGMSGFGAIPPALDGQHHGFFVARIVHTDSIDPDKVVVTDPSGTTKVATYYPLGMHASAAIATSLSDAPVGRVLVDFGVLFAAVVFPVGMYVLARFLAPERVLVAGLTALLTPVLVLYAYASVQGGLLGVLIGMAMLPVSVVVVIDALGVGSAKRFATWLGALVLPALMVFGVIVVHTTEAATLVILVGCLLAFRLTRRTVVAMAGRLLALSLIVVAMLALSLSGLASGASERSTFDPFAHSKQKSVGQAIKSTVELDNAIVTVKDGGRIFRGLSVHHDQVLYGALAVIGAAILLWRRQPAFVVAWAIVVALTVIAYSSNGVLSRTLTNPWYRQGPRLAMNLAFFVPFFAAIVLEAAISGLKRQLPGRNDLLVATTLVVAVAALGVGITGYRDATATIERDFGSVAARRVSATEAAFSWLHNHASAHDTVIDEVTDGCSWMYAEAGLRALVGMNPGGGNIGEFLKHVTPDLSARMDLIRRADRLGEDAQADALARRYGARWICYGALPLYPFRTMKLQSLLDNPHLHKVFSRDGVYIFRIDDEVG